jgi:hypothetical protein
MIEVVMENGEIEVIEFVANRKLEICRAANVKDRQVGDQDPLSIEVDGVMGEFAFCKHFNLYPDIKLRLMSKGHDCELWNGTRVDVKTTRHIDGNLVIERGKEVKDSDIYVLAIRPKRNMIQLIGWMDAERAINPGKIRIMRGSECYFTKREDLVQYEPEQPCE